MPGMSENTASALLPLRFGVHGHARKRGQGPKKGSGTKSAKHPKGRAGFWFLTPFSAPANFFGPTPKFSCNKALAPLSTTPSDTQTGAAGGTNYEFGVILTTGKQGDFAAGIIVVRLPVGRNLICLTRLRRHDWRNLRFKKLRQFDCEPPSRHDTRKFLKSYPSSNRNLHSGSLHISNAIRRTESSSWV